MGVTFVAVLALSMTWPIDLALAESGYVCTVRSLCVRIDRELRGPKRALLSLVKCIVLSDVLQANSCAEWSVCGIDSGRLVLFFLPSNAIDGQQREKRYICDASIPKRRPFVGFCRQEHCGTVQLHPHRSLWPWAPEESAMAIYSS